MTLSHQFEWLKDNVDIGCESYGYLEKLSQVLLPVKVLGEGLPPPHPLPIFPIESTWKALLSLAKVLGTNLVLKVLKKGPPFVSSLVKVLRKGLPKGFPDYFPQPIIHIFLVSKANHGALTTQAKSTSILFWMHI